MQKYIRLFILTIPYFLSAQDKRTYSGAYLFDNGTATYDYYENETMERVYNGKFAFKSKSYSVEGEYKANFKNGPWTYIAYDTFAHTKVKTKTVITGAYLDGYLHGTWSYKKIRLANKKVIVSSSCEFDHGVPNGTYFYFDSSKLSPNLSDDYNISVKGEFDSIGQKTRKWFENYDQLFTEGIGKRQVIREYFGLDSVRVIYRNLNDGAVEREVRAVSIAEDWNHRRNWEHCLSFWQCENNYNCPGNIVFTILRKGSIFVNSDGSKLTQE